VDDELTSKAKLHATGTYAHRELDASFAGDPDSALHGTDDLWSAGIDFDVLPTRASKLGCTISRERRRTGGDPISITWPCSATVGSCTGQIAVD